MEDISLDNEPPRPSPLPNRPAAPADLTAERVDKTSFKYRLRNQLISGFSFLPNIRCSIIFSFALGAILVGLGVGVLLVSNSIIEVQQRYDDICGINQPDCKVKVNIPQKIEKPVYFYLQVQNYYQNHRLYVKSYSSSQLLGENIKQTDIDDKCSPVTKNSDVASPLYVFTGTTAQLIETGQANPCGLIAKSYYKRDSFELYNPAGFFVTIRDTDLAWSVDRERKFKRNADFARTQYLDVEDERFINWMSFSTLYYWKKLWGVIEVDLEPGEYLFKVNNQLDVLSFEGEKYILLSNVSVLGGTSMLLATLLLIMGGLYVGLGILILLYKCVKRSKNELTYGNLDFVWD